MIVITHRVNLKFFIQNPGYNKKIQKHRYIIMTIIYEKTFLKVCMLIINYIKMLKSILNYNTNKKYIY